MSNESAAESPTGDANSKKITTLLERWEGWADNANTNPQRAHFAWEIIRHEYGDQILAVEETGRLYVCRHGVWEEDGEQWLRKISCQMMGQDYSRAVLNELADRVLAINAVPQDKLGVPRGTIAVRNGLLDLETRERVPLKPSDRAVYQLSVAHDPKAGCPRWRAFLQEVTGTAAGRRRLQEFVGYCIAGGKPWLKKALMIFGPTDAGKTVFLDVIEALFGEEANAAQTPQYLSNQRWGLDQILGKPVNIRHDVDAEKIQDIGLLKEIIDGNTVTAEQKGEDPYQFRPKTRLLFAANQAPKRIRDDEAFWNRWLTVTFPESIPPEDQANKSDLLQELTSELPGILNWALDGLDQLRANDGFTEPQSPDEVRQCWERYGDPVERFKQTRLMKDSDAMEPKKSVREAYRQFCTKNNFTYSEQDLGRALTDDPGIRTSQSRVPDGPGRTQVYVGVLLKENQEETKTDEENIR